MNERDLNLRCLLMLLGFRVAFVLFYSYCIGIGLWVLARRGYGDLPSGMDMDNGWDWGFGGRELALGRLNGEQVRVRFYRR